MTETKNAGPIGFICPRDDSLRRYDYCFMSCKTPCMSIPLLMAMARKRNVVEGRYSVTEIFSPPQQVYLKRNNEYHIKAKGSIWSTLGTAWHNVIEEGLKDMNEEERKHYHIEEENRFEVDFGYAVLSGRPDMWVDDIKLLRDFKTMKVYSAKRFKAGQWDDSTYPWQLNTYRWFKYPEAERLDLECVIKDWSTRSLLEGVHEYEIIEVPSISRATIEERVQELLKEHVGNQEDPTKIKPCSKEDVWFQDNPRSMNDGVPLRCKEYCDVHLICPQAREWYKMNGGWRDAKRVTTKRPQIIQQTMSED